MAGQLGADRSLRIRLPDGQILTTGPPADGRTGGVTGLERVTPGADRRGSGCGAGRGADGTRRDPTATYFFLLALPHDSAPAGGFQHTASCTTAPPTPTSTASSSPAQPVW